MAAFGTVAGVPQPAWATTYAGRRRRADLCSARIVVAVVTAGPSDGRGKHPSGDLGTSTRWGCAARFDGWRALEVSINGRMTRIAQPGGYHSARNVRIDNSLANLVPKVALRVEQPVCGPRCSS